MSLSDAIVTTVRSRDGAGIGVAEFGRAHRGGEQPSLLFLPALGVPLGYYADMLSTWSRRGQHVVAVELRGMPLSPVTRTRGQTYGYSTIVREDLPAIVRAMLSDQDPYVTVGHSLGGQLALLAAAAGTLSPVATAAIASGTSSPRAMSSRLGRAQRRAQVAFVEATSTVFGFWPGDRLGFGGRQPRSLMRDWCTEGRRGRYLLHGDGHDYEAALAALSHPVLLLSLDGDATIPWPAAHHLAERLPAHTEHRRLHSQAAGGFDHIRWVRREPDPVIDAVDAWVQQMTVR